MKRFLFVLSLTLTSAAAAVIMYGGNGGHNNGDSINDGWLVTINQTTGAVTPVGHPGSVSRISGLAFDLTGALFITTQGGTGFPPPPGPTTASNLIQINPATGAIINNIGLVKDAMGTAISIADLAVQPGTGLLYGIRGPNDQLGGQGLLYTINKTTGVATLVGNTGDFFGSIAFGPNGTLYMSAADLDGMGNFVVVGLKTLDPSNANTLSVVPTTDFFGAFGVRPDGVLFGGTGDTGQLFTINPITGAETLVGSTGRNFVGDVDFLAPEPSTLVLFGIGIGLLVIVKRACRS
jgi:hypothetical protein